MQTGPDKTRSVLLTGPAPRSRSAGLRTRLEGATATLAGPALLLVLFFFILPVALLLARSILEPEAGLGNYAELLQSGAYRTVLLNTFSIASVVTVVTVLIGFPVAWLIAVSNRFWGMALLGLIFISMWTSLLTRSFAWLILLQSNGVINRMLKGLGLISEPLSLVNNMTGVVIGMTYILLPFVIFPLLSTMRAIEPGLLRAAALCGANRWQCFLHVFLPACAPGIAAGALMVFVMSLGYFITPVMLGGSSTMMLAELIVHLVQSLLRWGLGAAAAFILFAITLAAYALQLRLFDPLRSAKGGS
ncbi:ABC transporter permease [Rhodobacter sp. 24-YEA-8]|uniref:ABC transporter permease n=1 Tax=Rhodobacter sp. 24-YEA-8 TaxID=1884310 RepID=UPI0008942921|nr:ABC transporter permease [Rhodobacter sp. 24-YEA-8]SED75800.1 putative spermidine/putrescine transport system permease protein [Rhodobacter sp. 24-YEA-8]